MAQGQGERGSTIREKFEAGCGMARSGLAVGAGALALALLASQFGALKSASAELLSRAGAVTKVSVAGVEVTLEEKAIAAALSQIAPAAASDARPVADAIAGLDPARYVRLIEIGALGAPCEYERPTAQMRADIAVDYALAESGLVTIASDEAARETALVDMRAAPAGSWRIGAPRDCYRVELTALGRDARTALTQRFKAVFRDNEGEAASPGAPAEVVKAAEAGGRREAALVR
ncbi:hypothetical protein [Methylocella sp.]|uniref:hypothetical protein n=1 Tax=Methylocella sp. TaxID=1978226 RepID=UPI0037852B13